MYSDPKKTHYMIKKIFQKTSSFFSIFCEYSLEFQDGIEYDNNSNSDESTIKSTDDAKKQEGNQHQSKLEVTPVVKKKRGRPKSASTAKVSLESAKTEETKRKSTRHRKETW